MSITDPVRRKAPSQGDVVGLAQEVGGLSRDVQGLAAALEDAVKQAAAAKDTADQSVSKEDAKHARKRLVVGMLIAVMVSTVFSIVTASAVASRCFIRPPQGGAYRTMCNLIPGYNNTEKQGLVEQQRFNQFLSQIPQNQAEIRRLYRHFHIPYPQQSQGPTTP